MLKRIKTFIYLTFIVAVLASSGCKKGTFDINDVNPNVPSTLDPKFVLSGALANTASLVRNGNPDPMQLYMGYWAVSGDYIPVTSWLTYQTSTDYGAGNWDNGYLILKNLREMEELASSDPNKIYYVGIGKIMEAFIYERLVDMYNDVPYSAALNGGVNNYPTYDKGIDVYTGLVNQIDTAINDINTGSANLNVENPGKFDVMFGGTMSNWIAFGNTIKLKIAMNLTQSASGSSLITTALAGLNSGSFLPSGTDAAVNPGYSNGSNTQQSPFYQDMGFNTSGAPQNNESYYRACDYTVKYLNATDDTFRLGQIYAPATALDTGVNTGIITLITQGRPFGSNVSSGQDNEHISAMGAGLLQTPSSPAVILSASESFLMAAEAVQRGYISGSSAAALYQTGVEESFRLLQVADPNNPTYTPAMIADSFMLYSTNPNVNFSLSSNPITTIIMQEWVSAIGFDPLQSWNNWRRLGIPANLPVSQFQGNTATHIPYRFLYPTSEYSYNTTNVNAEGTISNLTSKIFWQP